MHIWRWSWNSHKTNPTILQVSHLKGYKLNTFANFNELASSCFASIRNTIKINEMKTRKERIIISYPLRRKLHHEIYIHYGPAYFRQLIVIKGLSNSKL